MIQTDSQQKDEESFMTTEDVHLDKPTQSTGLGGWRWFFFYALMSMIIQWPLVGSITTHISYGHEAEITVPLLNLWTVWWNADRAADWLRGYWNAPIFFPTQKTFVFSEAQPTSIIVAPILGLTGNRGLAYNVYQLLILALNGFSAHRLLRRLGHIRWLAFCGGFMSQILPFVMWQFGVVQLTTLFGIYWTLHAVVDLFGTARFPEAFHETNDQSNTERTFETASVARTRFRIPLALRLGTAFGVTYWLCNYWGLFLFLLVVPSSICLWNRRLFERSFWRDLIFAGIFSFVMIGPFAWLQHTLSREHNWHGARTPDMVRDLSAHSRDHTDVPWYTFASRLEFPEKGREHYWSLGGGGLKLLLVPIGLIVSVWTVRRRRWGLFTIVFGALAFGLSLGLTVRFSSHLPVLGGICLYEYLQKYVPGFSLIRSPFRFCVFVQLAAVWMSIEALELLNPSRRIIQTFTQSKLLQWTLPAFVNPLFDVNRNNGLSISSVIPLILASALVTLEAVPPTTRLYELPSHQPLPTWVSWLRYQAEPNSAIACLPFPTGEDAKGYEETTLWMYWSTFHRHPLVSGYSGFFPDSFMNIKYGLEVFEHPDDVEPEEQHPLRFKNYAPDNAGLKLLNELPIRYVVVKRSFGTRDEVLSHPATQSRWSLVVSDETSEIDIYEVHGDE